MIPGTIAVLARSNNRAKHVQDALTHHSISSDLLTSAKSHLTKPVVMTMHTAKGMEFSRVVLFDISEGSVPLPAAFYETAPEDLADAMLRERSLLYVAASRARDELVVTGQAVEDCALGELRPVANAICSGSKSRAGVMRRASEAPPVLFPPSHVVAHGGRRSRSRLAKRSLASATRSRPEKPRGRRRAHEFGRRSGPLPLRGLRLLAVEDLRQRR